MSMKKKLVWAARWAYSNIVLKMVYPRIYNRYKKKPVDPHKVIFLNEEFSGGRDSFSLLYKHYVQDGTYHVHMAILGKNSISKIAYIKKGMQLMKELANAKYVYIDMGSELVSCVNMRPETVVTQLWHACGAFKKFGMSTLDAGFGRRLNSSEAHPLYKNMTYCTVSSPEVVWAYEEALQVNRSSDIVRPIGVSRTDVYFQNQLYEEAKSALYEHFPAAKGKKVILFAPTFRGKGGNARTADGFDASFFASKMGAEYVLVVKHHPHVPQRNRPAISKELEGCVIYDATDTMPIDQLLCTADIVITDYSSLIFEYSLLERPMIFFAYDLEEYFDERGFYYPYEEMTPGPVLRTNEELIDYIQHIDERFDRQQVIDFKERFMSACDGHATERILKLVELG